MASSEPLVKIEIFITIFFTRSYIIDKKQKYLMCAKNEVAAAFILLSRLIAAKLWDKNSSKRVKGA